MLQVRNEKSWGKFKSLRSYELKRTQVLMISENKLKGQFGASLSVGWPVLLFVGISVKLFFFSFNFFQLQTSFLCQKVFFVCFSHSVFCFY